MRKPWIIPEKQLPWTGRNGTILSRPIWRARCPTCEGIGGWIEYIGLDDGNPWEKCPRCRGVGHISLRDYLVEWLWDKIPLSVQEWYIEREYRRSAVPPPSQRRIYNE
jgi:hypothetical protein